MAIKTITVKGNPVVEEYTVNAALYPGMLCELMSTGNVRAHASAGETAERMFALEDENQGNEIGDAYTASNKGQFGIFRPGDQVYARLANGETAVIGSKLESNGDGYLRVFVEDSSALTVQVQCIVCVALEAVDMSGSSAADPTGLIRCRVM
jgi:hypothetical protein